MKTNLLKAILLLFALTLGIGSVGAETKTKYILTAPKDIKSGDIVVIVDTASLYAIQNDAEEGKAPSAGKITLNDNKDQLTGDIAANLEWAPEADGDLCNFTTGEGDSKKYLFVTDADDGLRVGTPGDGDVKAFGLAKDEGHNQADFLSVTIGSGYRYVGMRSMIIMNSWQTKTSIDDNIKNTKIAFFVKKESTKEDLTLKFDKADYQADYNGGSGTFTAPTLTVSPVVSVTYSSSNEAIATVDATGAITLKGRGTTKITVNADETETTDAASASYTLRVDDSTKKGSQADPFSPTEAIAYLKNQDISTGSDYNYFVEGYVAKIEEKGIESILSMSDNTKGTVTYWISNDGVYDDVTKNTLKISSGKYKELADLTDHVISVGDKVTVVGPLSCASTTPSSSTFGGSSSSSTSGSTTSGSSTSTEEKEYRMDATNYIHEHTPVLVKKDFEMIVNQEINYEDFVSETGLFTINTSALSGTATTDDATIESSNKSVAKVATSGDFTSIEVGTTVITVTVPATVDGKSYSLKGKFIVKVKGRNAASATADQYELVTDASSLTNGDKLLIVASNVDGIDDSYSSMVALSTTQDETERGTAEVTVNENIISTVPEDAQVVIYEVKNGKNYFNVGTDADGVKHYLYASSSEDDELKTGELGDANDNAAVEVTIDGSTNDATIKFQGSNTHNTLKFSGMLISGYDLGSSFKCVDESGSGSGTSTASSSSSKGSLPKIYRYVKTNTYDVTISDDVEWKSFVPGEDYTLPEGLQAYIVTEVDKDAKSASITEVTDKGLKADNAYILKGEVGTTYTLTTTTTEATAPEGNLLKVSDNKTRTGVYVLATKDGKTGFFKWTGGLLGSGRVYLPANVTTALAHAFISIFDGGTTGISSILNDKMDTSNNRIYNLQGQEVRNAKGIIIVNGKKVIIK